MDSVASTLSGNSASVARPVSIEFRKCYERWERDGLLAKYLSGANILDIGFRGGDSNAVPITDAAVGIELDYPGYDGTALPFGDETQDAIFASAVLEHIPNYKDVLKEWYRVAKVGGYVIVFVPHRYLYEKRPGLPSRWNGDHRRFYTSSSLLAEFEESLPCNGFRVRHLVEDDHGFRYADPLEALPKGNYQIELVVQKISIPEYSPGLHYSPRTKAAMDCLDELIILSIAQAVDSPGSCTAFGDLLQNVKYFIAWHKLEAHFVHSDPPEVEGRRLTRAQLVTIVRPLLALVDVDVASYVERYQQLSGLRDPALHWRTHGYFEGRLGAAFDFQSRE